MNIVLCSREDEQKVLSHGLVLCTEEEADYLMHYRTKGSVNGIRRYQYEDGSLTPEGYKHYGIGQGNRHKAKAEKLSAKTEKVQKKYDKAVLRTQGIAGMFGNKAKKEEKIRKLGRKLEVAQAKQRKEEAKADKQEERGLKKLDKDRNIAKTADFMLKNADKENKDIPNEVVDKVSKPANSESTESSESMINKYDTLSGSEKQKVGDELLQRTRGEPGGTNYDTAAEQWVMDEMDKKSGNANSGSFVKGSHGEKAYKELEDSYHKLWNREDEIDKEMHLAGKVKLENGRPKSNSDWQKLKEAYKSDDLWKSLSDNSDKSEQRLLSAVLRDLGMSDTPENREAIAFYVFID